MKISNLSSVIDRYDGVIFDQWGVLHDGKVPYDGVIDVLARLRASSRPYVVLSNSGKRVAGNRRRLRMVGLTDDLCPRLVSSGELTWRLLAPGAADLPPGFAVRREASDLGCWLITQPGETELVDDTPWHVVNDIEQALLILIAGLTPEARFGDFEPMLARGLERGLPLICANPDFDALFGDKTSLGSGQLARWYQERGGQVLLVGKPMAAAFEAALAALALPAGARVLMVGDSLYHDIAGAQAVGLDTLFITGGIHRRHLGATSDEAAVLALSRQADAEPSYWMPTLLW